LKTPLNSILSTNDICTVNIRKLKESIPDPTIETKEVVAEIEKMDQNSEYLIK